MKYLILNVAILLTLSTGSVCANQSNSFTWLEPSENAQLLKEIADFFADELSPDIPEKVKPIVPYFFKYIAKVGKYEDVYLVLIGWREHKNDDKEYDHFHAFSYDRENKIKSEVQPIDIYYKITFTGFAKFEPSSIKDVVFKYFNCLECESVELLSSFMFDEKENKWKLRLWPDNDPHLMIGSDTQIGDDFYNYDCLNTVEDTNNDGFDDIAIRCRETAESTKKFTKDFFLYTVQNGIGRKIKVQKIKDKNRLNSMLCKGVTSPLCK